MRDKEEGEQGFSLVELLVVIIIMGILAAVAIPMFLNQRKKAEDQAAKSDLATIGKEVAAYFTNNTKTPTVGGGNGAAYTITSDDLDPKTQNIGDSSENVTVLNSGAVTVSPNNGATGAASPPSRDNWCIAVENKSGDKKTFVYAVPGGLYQAADCKTAKK
jgi:prepilin-type N-terminal cleavage/methylation domain-containing protein